MSRSDLKAINARCKAEKGLCENCNIERLCCTCINAPWQLVSLYACLDEIKRLNKAVEASKQCCAFEMDECDKNIKCKDCDDWKYPHAVLKALEDE